MCICNVGRSRSVMGKHRQCCSTVNCSHAPNRVVGGSVYMLQLLSSIIPMRFAALSVTQDSLLNFCLSSAGLAIFELNFILSDLIEENPAKYYWNRRSKALSMLLESPVNFNPSALNSRTASRAARKRSIGLSRKTSQSSSRSRGKPILASV